MTWVVSDYTATPGTSEVSVTKGQQVEIIDTQCNGAPDFYLVRLNIHSGSAADGSGTIEGLVPHSVLKLAPNNKSVHRRGIDGSGVSSGDGKDTTENNGKRSFNLFWLLRIEFLMLEECIANACGRWKKKWKQKTNANIGFHFQLYLWQTSEKRKRGKTYCKDKQIRIQSSGSINKRIRVVKAKWQTKILPKQTARQQRVPF